MWIILIVPALMLLTSLALRPIRTLILISRFILFLYTAGAWIFLIYAKNSSDEVIPWELWLFAIGFTVLWMLTFIRRRQRIEVVVKSRSGATRQERGTQGMGNEGIRDDG